MPVSQLLRRMKVATVRLKLPEPEAWIDHELEGYSDDAELPGYRFILGVPQFFHNHWGWRNLALSENSLNNQLLSHIQFRQGIATAEEFGPGTGGIRMFYPGFLEEMCLPHMPYGVVRLGLLTDRSTVGAIVSSVRNKILDWGLAMEKAGITGEGMSFTQAEREAAQNVTYNLYGDNARINQNSTDNSTNTVVHGDFFGDLKARIRDGVQDPAKRDELVTAVEEMEGEKGKPGFAAAYAKFIAGAANHIQIVQPFLEGLTGLLGS
jgi:AbiTii